MLSNLLLEIQSKKQIAHAAVINVGDQPLGRRVPSAITSVHYSFDALLDTSKAYEVHGCPEAGQTCFVRLLKSHAASQRCLYGKALLGLDVLIDPLLKFKVYFGSDISADLLVGAKIQFGSAIIGIEGIHAEAVCWKARGFAAAWRTCDYNHSRSGQVY